MHLAQGLSTISTAKRKQKKLTQKDLDRLQVEWRKHNKDMRRKHMHDLQFKNFEDYVAYIRGQYKPQRTKEKEFKEYAFKTPAHVRDTKKYPSFSTSDKIPGACAKPERKEYTGTLIKGIATMHKSNAVPILNQKDAEDIANMRRN